MATPIPQNRSLFTAAEVAFAAGGTLVSGAADVVGCGVTTDSRQPCSGGIFVAIRGDRFDGHQFLDAAMAAGVSVVVVARDSEYRRFSHRSDASKRVGVVAVDDTLVALGRMARAHQARWRRERNGDGTIVAITGSAGKTSTKEMCAAALVTRLGAAVLSTRGNLNNRIGVPMTLFGLEASHRVAVIEMGTSRPGEIAMLAELTQPDIGVITNIGVAHAEGLASEWRGDEVGPHEAVAREKSALWTHVRRVAVANEDDVWVKAVLLRATTAAPHLRTATFGASDQASYRLGELLIQANGTSRIHAMRRNVFTVDGKARAEAEAMSVAIPLLGEVAAMNALGAIAAADAALVGMGGSVLSAQEASASFQTLSDGVSGRLVSRRRADGAIVLDDSYNANPASYRAAIRTAVQLASSAGRRLIIVAGEMRELGPIAGHAHDELARQVCEAEPTTVITCGGHADRVAEAAVRAGSIDVYRGVDTQDALHEAVRRVGPDTLVLVKGSRGVMTDKIVDAILAQGGEIREGRSGVLHKGEAGAD